jgi:hypothetical protein
MNENWQHITNDGVYFLAAGMILYIGAVVVSELYQRYLFRKARRQRALYYLCESKDKEDAYYK